mmetsp:Transcript_53816/g.127914  ORF Transcript_53816/g.127914 Transcript_53816/m.127914 type:complete len:330 (-) Transcript_53816:134-1123(-)
MMENVACTLPLSIPLNSNPTNGESLALTSRTHCPVTPPPKECGSDEKCPVFQPSARQLNTHVVGAGDKLPCSLSATACSAAILSYALCSSFTAETPGPRCVASKCASMSFRSRRASHPGHEHATSSCSHFSRCRFMAPLMCSTLQPSFGHSTFANVQLPSCSASNWCSICPSQCAHLTLRMPHVASCSARSFRGGDSVQPSLGHFTGTHWHSRRCAASPPTLPFHLHPAPCLRSSSKRATSSGLVPGVFRPRCRSSFLRACTVMDAAGSSLARFAAGGPPASSLFSPCSHRSRNFPMIPSSWRLRASLLSSATGRRHAGHFFCPTSALT